ncbi:hypothetical protein RE9425_03390 [Prescottella equi]|nr:hypothetical protein RE9425_03390 [Prescottella equi]
MCAEKVGAAKYRESPLVDVLEVSNVQETGGRAAADVKLHRSRRIHLVRTTYVKEDGAWKWCDFTDDTIIGEKPGPSA